MSTKNRNIYSIIGPTAIGKSKIAIELVDKYPFEIISLDSSMIYREMNIGTDKPDSKILSNINIISLILLIPMRIIMFFNTVKILTWQLKRDLKIKKFFTSRRNNMYFNALNGLDDVPKRKPC